MYLKGNIANKYSFLIIPKIYFVNYYYAGKTNFSFSSESQRKFERRYVLEFLLEPTSMNNVLNILKYTHPYLLSNRTCSKYFVISNAAIDSLPAPWTFRLESAQL